MLIVCKCTMLNFPPSCLHPELPAHLLAISFCWALGCISDCILFYRSETDRLDLEHNTNQLPGLSMENVRQYKYMGFQSNMILKYSASLMLVWWRYLSHKAKGIWWINTACRDTVLFKKHFFVIKHHTCSSLSWLLKSIRSNSSFAVQY